MVYTWHKVEQLTVSALQDNVMQEITVGEKQVCFLRKDGEVYAFSATCPHAGASLCEGWIDARGRVVCPLHGYRFDPHNGRNTSGEGYKLRTYPVEVRNNEIFIAIL